MSAPDLRVLLAELAAVPRPAGSEAEGAARARCARLLAELGFAVREEPFAYSALPGRWGTPLVGTLSAAALLAASALGRAGRGDAALLLLLAALAGVGAGAAWLARRGVLEAPLLRREGRNLVAVRGGDEPALWLLAHLDSKSQPVPIGLRALGVTASIVAWLLGLALAVVQVAGLAVEPWWPWLGGAGALAALPVALTTVGARSPGAFDDASGVAVVIGAAALLPPLAPVGVLLTSAEELGLAGARAWVRGRAAGVAINVDGVDDVGRVTLMWSGRRPDRLLRAFDASPEPVRSRRLVPGILTDGVALADAGWTAVTVSRGRWTSLARVHRPHDDLHHLRGERLADTAAVVAAAASALLADRPALSKEP